MTSKKLITTGALVSAGVAAAVIAVGTASSASAAVPNSGTFTLRAHHGTDTNVDLGKSGFSAGDEDLFTGPLTYHGDRVGRLVGECTMVRVGATVDQLCEFVLRIGSAQLTADGAVHAGAKGPGTFTLPIVGGTGRYRAASGVITVSATDGGAVPITVSLGG
jgi:hypothetical protein